MFLAAQHASKFVLFWVSILRWAFMVKILDLVPFRDTCKYRQWSSHSWCQLYTWACTTFVSKLVVGWKPRRGQIIVPGIIATLMEVREFMHAAWDEVDGVLGHRFRVTVTGEAGEKWCFFFPARGQRHGVVEIGDDSAVALNEMMSPPLEGCSLHSKTKFE